jgi:general secretion pathway protein K
MKESQRGIALLIVLWVMTILMTMVLSFSLMTRAETYGTLAFKESMEKQFLAEAGVERGIAEMINRSVNFGQTVILEGKAVWKTDGTAYYGRMGNGGYVVRITDESGKIALNRLTDASGVVVNTLLINMGVSPENADTIVDSILDWKDADDLHRLHGAEDDYYLSLPHPYKARNADFETLEELLLVKGVTPEILYGTGKTKGLLRFLSLYNKTNLININAAPTEILAALPGMNAAMAEQIVEFRKSSEINSVNDVMGIIGGSFPLMAPYISGQSGVSMVCTIETTGYQDVEKKGYSVRATVAMDGPSRRRYLYYRSPAETVQ